MIDPVFSTTVAGFPLADGQLIWDLDFWPLSGGTELVSLSYGGDILTRFDLTSGDPVYSTQQILTPTGAPLGLGADMHTLTIGGSDYVVLSGFAGSATPVYSMAANGQLSESASALGDLSFQGKVSDIASANIAGSDILFATDHVSGTLMSYGWVAGAFDLVATAPVHPGFTDAAFHHLDTVAAHGQHFILVTDTDTNALHAYRADVGGTMVLTDTIGAPDGLGVATPTAVGAATTGGKTFVVLAAAGSGSLSVFELTATGGLIATDHLSDTRDTRFDGASELAISQVGDHVFVTAAGHDAGFSLFSLLPDGTLHLQAVVEDDAQTSLANPSALTTRIDGATLSVAVASEGEDGISWFDADLSNLGDVLLGTSSGESLTGTGDDDLILGQGGADTLSGAAGDDVLSDGAGTDGLTGGAGNDVFRLTHDQSLDTIWDFDPAEDRLDLSLYPMFHGASQLGITSTSWGAQISYLGDSTDIYTVSGTPLTSTDFDTMTLVPVNRSDVSGISIGQYLVGTVGTDVLQGGNAGDILRGGSGGDVLVGGGGRDMADYGGGGAVLADLLVASVNTGDAAGDSYQGVDGFIGSDHADTLRGNDLANEIEGRGGNDILIGRGGNDQLIGGDGDDILRGGAGADDLQGGGGQDMADYTASSAGLTVDMILTALSTGEAAGDTFQGVDGILGSVHGDILRGGYTADLLVGNGGADMLEGREGNDHLKGGGGDDILRGGRGADLLEGGVGKDIADYGQATSGILADLAQSFLNSGEAAGDTYSGIDGLAGSNRSDDLRGTYLNETFQGRNGNDIINARAGDDWLNGGEGNDLLTGGPGSDVFEFNAGMDTITDFASGDTIGFDPVLWNHDPWDIADILNTAAPTPDGLTFTFSPQNTLTLTNIASTSQIEDDIFII